MKPLHAVLCSIFIAFILIFTGCQGAEKNKDYIIDWEDQVVEAGFREWLGKPDGDIYRSELDNVKQVQIAGTYFYVNTEKSINIDRLIERSSIQSLADFSHCIQLESLNIIYFNLTSLDSMATLASLKNFKKFEISDDTELNNIDGLSSLNNLETLSLLKTNISDISPLSDLNKLKYLSLGLSPVNDLTPISDLALKELFIHETQVNDWESIMKMDSLEALVLNEQFSDLSQLSELTNLKYLRISNTEVLDLSPLTELSQLEYLDISFTYVSDLSPLSELMHLNELTAVRVPVADWSPADHVETINK